MKFSEFLNRREVESFNLDYSEKCNKELILIDIDSLLTEYNAYLQEQQNKPVTSEFLLGLGFEKILYYTKSNDSYEIVIDLHDPSMSITDYSSETTLPFPKTQKDVTDLMRLLELK